VAADERVAAPGNPQERSVRTDLGALGEDGREGTCAPSVIRRLPIVSHSSGFLVRGAGARRGGPRGSLPRSLGSEVREAAT
jgi:hypothetical protein